MDFLQTLEHCQVLATGGSLYERLRRSGDVECDPEIAHASLVYDADHRRILAAVFAEYIETVKKHRVPMLIGTTTWKASPPRVAASRFSGCRVNHDNAVFARELASSRQDPDTPIYVAGVIGGTGDAYKPETSLPEARAHRVHAESCDELADGGVDLLTAMTLPSVAEARGMARAMCDTGLPYIISFVIRDDGTVLDGTPLQQAIESIDEQMTRPPVGYLTNCIHPQVLELAFEHLSPAGASRLLGIRANTARLRPEELDSRDELVTEEPAVLAEHVARLRRRAGIKIVGGCCGTNASHIDAMLAACGEPR